jgi:hypothetical protein
MINIKKRGLKPFYINKYFSIADIISLTLGFIVLYGGEDLGRYFHHF